MIFLAIYAFGAICMATYTLYSWVAGNEIKVEMYGKELPTWGKVGALLAVIVLWPAVIPGVVRTFFGGK